MERVLIGLQGNSSRSPSSSFLVWVPGEYAQHIVVLISRRPDGSGRAVRHTYLGRSSIEPTTILLRKQKYRLIGIGPFTCRAIAGALGRRALRVQIKVITS
jgi:hypothetical protein